ncbi:hypothetical protein MRB53_036987 [Persea americana]|nr:hypothetical protein MRB53_036987 [Persea americana]
MPRKVHGTIVESRTMKDTVLQNIEMPIPSVSGRNQTSGLKGPAKRRVDRESHKIIGDQGHAHTRYGCARSIFSACPLSLTLRYATVHYRWDGQVYCRHRGIDILCRLLSSSHIYYLHTRRRHIHPSRSPYETIQYSTVTTPPSLRNPPTTDRSRPSTFEIRDPSRLRQATEATRLADNPRQSTVQSCPSSSTYSINNLSYHSFLPPKGIHNK